ncbi:MAG TPA: FecR domain-containing protein [Planctomycetota bacterium]|nr:FecR domain-containing protein [Planctomycetota bacterium]
MDMDCKTSADLVTRSLSGNASAQDEAQLRAHVAACPACAGLQRDLSRTWALMGSPPVLASTSPAPSLPAPRRIGSLWLVGAAAAAVLVVSAIAYMMSSPAAAPTPVNPIAKQAPAEESRPEQRREEERVQEVLTHIENEKPETPAPVPAPAPAPAPENKTVAAPEAPAPKPAAPETPERKEVVVKPPVPETRPVEKTAPAPVAPAPAPLPVVATVDHIEGEAFVLIDGKRGAVKSGHKLVAGDSLETSGKGGQAAVEFPDGTRLVLGADTVMDSIDTQGGKRISLKQGVLAAQVAKQPAGEPMIFVTHTAEARVLGTRLTLSVTPTSTRLEVREGRVRITRKDDNASAEVPADQFVVAGKGTSMIPKPAPSLRFALHETFERARWGGNWLQGGEANLGIRLASENGSLSIKTLQKPAQDLGGGKMPTEAGELARKAVQGVASVSSLSRKDWPRSAWLETRQTYAFSNETPLRIRTRSWNSQLDPDRIVWMALNHGVAGQGLSLERRGASLQLWVEGANAAVWSKDFASPQEWEAIELWVSKDLVVVRRNDDTLYSGANPLKIKAAGLSLGVNAKMELAQDEEVRYDDVDVLLSTKAELEEVSR